MDGVAGPRDRQLIGCASAGRRGFAEQPGGCSLSSEPRKLKNEGEVAGDCIQKEVRPAPRARRPAALTRAEEFGTWFGAWLIEMVPGAMIRGPITYPGYEHRRSRSSSSVEPEGCLFLWHLHAVDPAVDYTSEPRTRVIFELVETAEGSCSP